MTTSASFQTPPSVQYDHFRQLPSATEGSSRATLNQDTALRGASLAFVKGPIKPKAPVNTYSGTNGARAAAARADWGRVQIPGEKQSEALPQSGELNSSRISNAVNVPLTAAQHSVSRGQNRASIGRVPSTSITLPRDAGTTLSSSPSSIAAALATARLTPQNSGGSTRRLSRNSVHYQAESLHDGTLKGSTPTPVNGKTKKRPVSQPSLEVINMDQKGIAADGLRPTETTDSTSIPPAASLIGMFEQNPSKARSTKTTTKKLIRSTNPPPVIQSPQPIRPLSSGGTTLTATLTASQRTTMSPIKPNKPSVASSSKFGPQIPTPPARRREATETGILMRSPSPQHLQDHARDAKRPIQAFKIAPDRTQQRNAQAPRHPPSRKARSVRQASNTELQIARGSDGSSSDSSYASAHEVNPKPKVPPPRRTRNQSPDDVSWPSGHERQRSNQSHLPKPPPKGSPPTQYVRVSAPSSMDDRPASTMGEKRIRSNRRSLTPSVATNALADAIVASSLASSRAPSPSKSPAPALPPRQFKLFHHNPDHQLSRTPSPSKGMKQTLRKPPKSDEETEASKRSKKRFVKKHPNKHHEGDRKRWRDQVTQRERKRYEGVWAANKDTFNLETTGSSSQPDGTVSNIVVRDIWSRSRLGPDVLEEVWELVDRQRIGRLTREEYVVGMWLIDQRLKGRKLPIKVSPSVWDSVRQLSGLKLPLTKA